MFRHLFQGDDNPLCRGNQQSHVSNESNNIEEVLHRT